MPAARLRLYCQHDSLAAAEALADICHIEHIEVTERAPTPTDAPLLWLDEAGLSLLLPGRRAPFRLSPQKYYKRLAANTDLVRACGVTSQGAPLRVLDVFGGFCIDALMLARAGARVEAFEQHPVIYCLARAFLAHFSEDVCLKLGDGLQRLEGAEGVAWDVVYLDPMFAPRTKAALPGLPAQVLRQLNHGLLPDEAEAAGYVELAMSRARRVVFKRPAKDPVIANPNHQYKGRSVRYDVYV